MKQNERRVAEQQDKYSPLLEKTLRQATVERLMNVFPCVYCLISIRMKCLIDHQDSSAT